MRRLFLLFLFLLSAAPCFGQNNTAVSAKKLAMSQSMAIRAQHFKIPKVIVRPIFVFVMGLENLWMLIIPTLLTFVHSSRSLQFISSRTLSRWPDLLWQSWASVKLLCHRRTFALIRAKSDTVLEPRRRPLKFFSAPLANYFDSLTWKWVKLTHKPSVLSRARCGTIGSWLRVVPHAELFSAKFTGLKFTSPFSFSNLFRLPLISSKIPAFCRTPFCSEVTC
jgi:hypothetical protein